MTEDKRWWPRTIRMQVCLPELQLTTVFQGQNENWPESRGGQRMGKETAQETWADRRHLARRPARVSISRGCAASRARPAQHLKHWHLSLLNTLRSSEGSSPSLKQGGRLSQKYRTGRLLLMCWSSFSSPSTKKKTESIYVKQWNSLLEQRNNEKTTLHCYRVTSPVLFYRELPPKRRVSFFSLKTLKREKEKGKELLMESRREAPGHCVR